MENRKIVCVILSIIGAIFYFNIADAKRYPIVFNDEYKKSSKVKMDIDWYPGISIIVTLPDSLQYGEMIRSPHEESCTYVLPLKIDSLVSAFYCITGSMFHTPTITNYTDSIDYELKDSVNRIFELSFIRDGKYFREVNYRKERVIILMEKLPVVYKPLIDSIIDSIEIIPHQEDE